MNVTELTNGNLPAPGRIKLRTCCTSNHYSPWAMWELPQLRCSWLTLPCVGKDGLSDLALLALHCDGSERRAYS